MVRREEAVALVTAAGASSRMGRPKALVTWPPGATTTLLEHQLAALAGFRAVVVVIGAHALEVPAPAVTVVNERWAEGRSTSIEAGARALPDDARAVLVAAVDQPLDAAVIDVLLAALGDGDAAVQPLAVDARRPDDGPRRGHPIVFAGDALPLLRAASSFDEGLRGITRARPAMPVPVASAAIHLDLNTPEDLV